MGLVPPARDRLPASVRRSPSSQKIFSVQVGGRRRSVAGLEAPAGRAGARAREGPPPSVRRKFSKSNPGPARERPTPRIRPSVPVEPENFQCPGRRSEEVCRRSRSPSREGRGKGPRGTDSPPPSKIFKVQPWSRPREPDSPHPSVGPRRARKFSVSRSEVGGGLSRVSKPQPGGQGQGPARDRLRPSVENFQSPTLVPPARDRLPASVRRSPSSPKIFSVQVGGRRRSVAGLEAPAGRAGARARDGPTLRIRA